MPARTLLGAVVVAMHLSACMASPVSQTIGSISWIADGAPRSARVDDNGLNGFTTDNADSVAALVLDAGDTDGPRMQLRINGAPGSTTLGAGTYSCTASSTATPSTSMAMTLDAERAGVAADGACTIDLASDLTQGARIIGTFEGTIDLLNGSPSIVSEGSFSVDDPS